MEDILLVERENAVFHVRSKSDRFPSQTCAAEYDALLKQLVAYGLPRDEFDAAWGRLKVASRIEVEVTLAVPLSQP